MATDSVRRVKAEAKVDLTEPKDTSVKVPFRDVEFTVSTDPMEWGHNAMEYLNESRIGPALKAMLGKTQYTKFDSMEASGYEAIELLNAISSKAGSGDSGN